MQQYNEKLFYLLGEVRERRAELDFIEYRIRQALGLTANRYYRDGAETRAVKGFLALLIERPTRWLVDKLFDWLERKRDRKSARQQSPS